MFLTAKGPVHNYEIRTTSLKEHNHVFSFYTKLYTLFLKCTSCVIYFKVLI